MSDSEPLAKRRFIVRTDEEETKLLQDRDSPSTKSNTRNSVHIFEEWLKETGVVGVTMAEDLLGLPNDRIDLILSKFYSAAMKKDGTSYKINAMKSLRYGIAKFLEQKNNTDIINSPDYKGSNTMFTSRIVELKKQGFGAVEHHPEIDEEDLLNMYSKWDTDTAQSLMDKVQFDIMLYLCRRGQENLREMKKDHFALAQLPDGREYVYQRKDELDKNHRADHSMTSQKPTEGIMLEQKGYLYCPVKSFKAYIDNLNCDNEWMWQAPIINRSPSSTSCGVTGMFSRGPIGKNKLAGLMARLSKQCGLSKNYTNHSIRATAVTLLDQADFKSRMIMKVSGHRSEMSIKSYSHRINNKTKCAMSAALGAAVGYQAPPQSTSAETITPLTDTSPEITISESDAASVGILPHTLSQDATILDLVNVLTSENALVPLQDSGPLTSLGGPAALNPDSALVPLQDNSGPLTSISRPAALNHPTSAPGPLDFLNSATNTFAISNCVVNVNINNAHQ